MNFVSIVIPAAGIGKRMKAGMPKQFLELDGVPIIIRTIDKFHGLDSVDEIILVINEDDEGLIKHLLKEHDIVGKIKFVYGGHERQDSVYNGLKATDMDSDKVLIHDGARPFIESDTIETCISELDTYDGVIVGVKSKDTIKRVVDGKFETLKRDELYSIQTPQCFKTKLILEAYKKSIENKLTATDDSSIFEQFFDNMKIQEGSYNNIKITTPEDLVFGEAIIKAYK